MCFECVLYVLFRPQEVSCEEVSVYDVKDHMDYKFRPGHVVVRIGGHNNTQEVRPSQQGTGIYYS